MSLYTGKEIHWDECVELPINYYVVKRAEELANKYNQPSLTNIPCLNEHQGYLPYTTW